ncbi:hypothetical protein HHL19_21700 [Streptomyces sp. R302]|uniref:hypothetical protein n=1 Tax=unclassified Streptomyces TaxID=2593676 RepID=UPI00145E9D22|nr:MULTISPECIES: hypothetical protein [unclassified Streptomyces]NML51114.1 hypothetical protein [Streptomyces sp. R301]NML81209.1 hypothetical protein [Streptomyces sp. R302]
MGPGARLSTRLLGAAQYAGSPPWWLVAEGFFVASAAALLVSGAGAGAVLIGMTSSQAEAAVLVATAAVALYLLFIRAGHLLVALLVAVGFLFAPAVSALAADAVLSGAGRTQDVVVTAVAHEPLDRPVYRCSVRLQDGSPVRQRLWRGCGPEVVPGDLIGMVYDPRDRVAPRGLEGRGPLLRRLAWTTVLLLGFAAVSFVAVVRSYRVSSVGSDQPRGSGSTSPAR